MRCRDRISRDFGNGLSERKCIAFIEVVIVNLCLFHNVYICAKIFVVYAPFDMRIRLVSQWPLLQRFVLNFKHLKDDSPTHLHGQCWSRDKPSRSVY